jgi:hypothetical protein
VSQNDPSRPGDERRSAKPSYIPIAWYPEST